MQNCHFNNYFNDLNGDSMSKHLNDFFFFFNFHNRAADKNLSHK